MKNTLVIIGVFAALLLAGASVMSPKGVPSIGVSAGPIDQNNYHCWGGVCEYWAATSLKTATTTPCAFLSPSATSTLISATVRLDTSSTTATLWDVARASTQYATTTSISAAYLVAASGQAYIQASTTGPNAVIPPSTYIVVGARQGITAGDSAGTGFVPAGQCAVKFITSQS